MDRKTMFRAWWNNKMYYSGFVVHADGNTEWPEGGWDLHGTDDKLNIMQYTGLKDKKGKEIYEGDIVSMDGKIFKVLYGLYSYAAFGITKERYVDTDGVGSCPTLDILNPRYTRDCEVIGNLHENQELLECNDEKH